MEAISEHIQDIDEPPRESDNFSSISEGRAFPSSRQSWSTWDPESACLSGSAIWLRNGCHANRGNSYISWEGYWVGRRRLPGYLWKYWVDRRCPPGIQMGNFCHYTHYAGIEMPLKAYKDVSLPSRSNTENSSVCYDNLMSPSLTNGRESFERAISHGQFERYFDIISINNLINRIHCSY